jgi:hypothetical protein
MLSARFATGVYHFFGGNFFRAARGCARLLHHRCARPVDNLNRHPSRQAPAGKSC